MLSTNTSLKEMSTFLSIHNVRARRFGETSACPASFRSTTIAKTHSTADDFTGGRRAHARFPPRERQASQNLPVTQPCRKDTLAIDIKEELTNTVCLFRCFQNA